MRITVFGGSFSPVHIGHLAVAEGILRKSLTDKVWLMPCRQNPLKKTPKLMADESRLLLLNEAVKWHNAKVGKEEMEVTSIELTMPSPSYTIDTLHELSSQYPEHSFRLAVGADSYLDFKKWKLWEKIELEFNPIVYPRPGYPLGKIRPLWTLLDGVKEFDVSSTYIREILKNEQMPTGWMPWVDQNKALWNSLRPN